MSVTVRQAVTYKCVASGDPIYEACGDTALTIYVSGAENSDGRNTWELNTRLVCLGHCRGSVLIFGLTVVGRTDLQYRDIWVDSGW
jgi:hypothetical protein